MKTMKTICVVGLGYIGLPTASLLARKGYAVHGMDVRADVVRALNSGEILIHEPGLAKVVEEAVSSGRLKAYETPTEADIFILALPTPFMEGKKPDLSYVRAGVAEIAPFVRPGNIIILESTSPVGTTEKICHWLHETRPELVIPGQPGGKGEQLYVAHCPERVLPGKILQELVENDRIVGGVDVASTQKVAEFYKTFVNGAVLETNARTAELSKLVENSFRDVNIAFANELSIICEKLDIDVWETIRLANRHPRVNILNPGTGVGGHCISVDPWFIVDAAPKEARLIRMARETNDYKADWVYEHIEAQASGFKKPVIACFGLAFKPDIDDLRESPAMHITERLASHKDWTILVVEPYLQELPFNIDKLGNVKLVNIEDALKIADIVAFLVAHSQFYLIDDAILYEKIVIDPCGIFNKHNYRNC